MPTILCVDDEADILVLLESVLRLSGYEPLPASTAAEALALVAERPDLAILDVNLPDLDGIECCRRMKRLDPWLPVLFVTAATAARRAEALAAGGGAFVEKPFDIDELLDEVARLLARRSERRAGGERRGPNRHPFPRGERRQNERRQGAVEGRLETQPRSLPIS